MRFHAIVGSDRHFIRIKIGRKSGGLCNGNFIVLQAERKFGKKTRKLKVELLPEEAAQLRKILKALL